MGIIDRLNLLVRSNLSARREEHDQETVHSTLAEMEVTLRQARARLKGVLDDERRLERELDESRQEEERWEQRAVMALEKKDEELARDALMERNKVSQRTGRIMEELREHRSYLADLMSGLEALESKLDGMRTRRPRPSRTRRREDRPRRSRPLTEDARRWEEMQRRRRRRRSEPPIVREPVSDAPAVDTALDRLDETVSKFDEMEDKIGRLEAEVEATRELEMQPYDEDDPLYDPKLAELERRFQELETRRRLGELKKKD